MLKLIGNCQVLAVIGEKKNDSRAMLAVPTSCPFRRIYIICHDVAWSSYVSSVDLSPSAVMSRHYHLGIWLLSRQGPGSHHRVFPRTYPSGYFYL